MQQHKMSRDEWEARITQWYMEHRGMLRYVCTDSAEICVTDLVTDFRVVLNLN